MYTLYIYMKFSVSLPLSLTGGLEPLVLRVEMQHGPG